MTNLLERNTYFQKIEGHSSADERRLSFSTGAIANERNSIIEVFPYPAEDYFTLSYQIVSDSTFPPLMELFDLNGRLVKSQVLVHSQDQVLVSTEDIPSGTYLVTISEGGLLRASTSLTVIENK